MSKYLIVTKDKDYISRYWKSVAKKLKDSCMVYDSTGCLIYPYSLYDGEDRLWAKRIIENHNVGDCFDDAEDYYFSKADNTKYNGGWIDRYANGKYTIQYNYDFIEFDRLENAKLFIDLVNAA